MGYKKITLGGNQVCDFLYVSGSRDDTSQFQYIDAEPNKWNSDTLMLAKFSPSAEDASKIDMSAGNSSLTDKIEGYEIRRKSGNNLYTEYVGTVKEKNDGSESKKYIVDYMVKNNTDYTYYLYPATKYSNNGILLSPSITSDVKTDWGYWSLLVVDESDEDNVFYLNKMFKFELNVSPDTMNNNAVVSVQQNFTKYPTIQYGTSNYWSGGLSALCGYVSCADGRYVQSPNMIDELKMLTSDTRHKFLKDIEGNIWEVKITAPISVSEEYSAVQSVKSVTVSWTEVGEVSGISIINNPDAPTTSWLLTETGEIVPYIDYVWDDNSYWDNSYRWTAREDALQTEESNLGRAIYYSEGGDKND